LVDFQIAVAKRRHSTGMRLGSAKVCRRGAVIFFGACGSWLAAACDRDERPAEPPPEISGIFGGVGGVGGIPDATPLAGGGGASGSAGAGAAGSANDACGTTPPGKVGLIDDFDDGDSVAVYEANRDAYWFTVTDGSDGTIEPGGEFLPVAGGYRGTRSAHVSASGYSVWGAELIINISHEGAVRCPYDASEFRGLSFVARGSGRVRVQVAMPGVVDKEYGGTCDSQAGQVCYDMHGTFIALGEKYQVYELPWDSLQQRGFGVSVPFDPKTMTAIHFAMEKEELPVDLWLDQVQLWDGTPASQGGAGGAGGAGGEPEGGQGSGGAPAPETGGAG
jgi:hypothetical protein